jgi:hypothetical protein
MSLSEEEEQAIDVNKSSNHNSSNSSNRNRPSNKLAEELPNRMQSRILTLFK